MPSAYWKDRLERMYGAGLNTIQTYVPWNFHETVPGVFDFEGDKDLEYFLKTAQDTGLLVVLRPGPYIDAEWDMGGLPSWLLTENVTLRTSDPVYLKYVDRWMSVLLPKIYALLYENGGPIITVQVENEYGSYFACDKDYMQHLEGVFRQHLGNDVVLFTTDGAAENYLKCGTLPSLYSTVDFGITSTPQKLFAIQREYEPHGPLVNSEFYPGWFDFWGGTHQTRDTTSVAESLDAILSLNASVNMYMFEGGTNFAFWNGADIVNDLYSPVTTSYDYNAPLTEYGDPWDKYTAIRKVISNHRTIPSNYPPPLEKRSYGDVYMTAYSSLFSSPELVVKEVTADDPVSMETLGQSFGFVVYSAIPSEILTGGGELTLHGMYDRAVVFVNGTVHGSAMRKNVSIADSTVNISLPTASGKTALDIVVENLGRICYGTLINDSKGILDGISFNNKPVKQWTSKSVPLNDTSKISFASLDSTTKPATSMVFFKGTFVFDGTSYDTFLNVSGWSKGQAFVNGFNVGRYWPTAGPQKMLYVPAHLLRSTPKSNELILFETDAAPCVGPDFTECVASLVSTPDIG